MLLFSAQMVFINKERGYYPHCLLMPQKLTTEEFIKRAKKVHGNKYDYSKVEYVNSQTKICIICPEHGEFWQVPNSHLLGYGCAKCAKRKLGDIFKKTTEEFIAEATIVHDGKYDYSRVKYEGKDAKVCIICPKHGEFWQSPHNHLKGAGCPKCKREKISNDLKDTTETFIEKARLTHGNKYDYSKVNYVDSYTKVCIICPEHGEFWQKPNNHIHGWGCAKCSGMAKKTTEEFIKQSKILYPGKYDYGKTEYVNAKTPVIITCKKHGDFKVRSNDHLRGQECPECAIYKLEGEIKSLLDSEGINYVWQYSNKFLGNQRLDFYLPEHKIAIECQGEQHFHPIKFFGGEEKHLIQKAWDERKRKICSENNVLIIYYTTKKNFIRYSSQLPKNTFFSKESIIEEIKKRVL